MILSARFVVLDIYSDSKVGRSQPVILLAVFTIVFSLFLCFCVALLNQTIIENVKMLSIILL